MYTKSRASRQGASGGPANSRKQYASGQCYDSIFEDEDKGEGDSVTDLVLLILRILRRDLSELASSIELVDLYNKG